MKTINVHCDANSQDYIEIDYYNDGSMGIQVSEDSGGDRRNDCSVIYITDRAKAIQIRDAIDVWINGGCV